MTPEEYRAQQAAAMTEAALLGTVRRLAVVFGWLTYHTHRSDRSEPGFPDLVLVRQGRLIFAELKRQKTRPTTAQRRWLDALTVVAAPLEVPDPCGFETDQPFPSPVEVHLWRPLDLLDGTIERVLRGGPSVLDDLLGAPPATSPPPTR
jgi:hypothetical protein